MRKAVIAGNWKMYKTAKEAELFIDELSKHPLDEGVEVFIAPAFPAIHAAINKVSEKKLSVRIGAQNLSEHPEGAYTGEVAAIMLANLGVHFVIIGHSERRHLFHESNATIHKKLHRAVEQGLTPVLCVGETDQERKLGHTKAVLEKQITEALSGCSVDFLKNLIIAYEPVWAIGTGNAATPEMAEEVHGEIRLLLGKVLGSSFASGVRILYGGSVKPESIRELMKQGNIDGALIGGASLEPDSFQLMVNYQN